MTKQLYRFMIHGERREFLSVLNEQEKRIIGSLIYKVSHIDGVLEEEENLLNNYKILGLRS